LPSAVFASTGTMKGAPQADYDVDDKVAIVLEYPDGGIGSIVSCYITLPGEMRVTLHGVNGCLDSNAGNMTYMIGDKTQEISLPPQEYDPITAQMRHFAEVVSTGKESEIAGTKRAYEVMQIVDAAYRSAAERTRIEIG